MIYYYEYFVFVPIRGLEGWGENLTQKSIRQYVLCLHCLPFQVCVILMSSLLESDGFYLVFLFMIHNNSRSRIMGSIFHQRKCLEWLASSAKYTKACLCSQFGRDLEKFPTSFLREFSIILKATRQSKSLASDSFYWAIFRSTWRKQRSYYKQFWFTYNTRYFESPLIEKFPVHLVIYSSWEPCGRFIIMNPTVSLPRSTYKFSALYIRHLSWDFGVPVFNNLPFCPIFVLK